MKRPTKKEVNYLLRMTAAQRKEYDEAAIGDGFAELAPWLRWVASQRVGVHKRRKSQER